MNINVFCKKVSNMQHDTLSLAVFYVKVINQKYIKVIILILKP